MSRNARIPLFLFTSILLLFTIFWFTLVSHLPSPISAKVFTFSKHQEHDHDVSYVKDSKNQENSSWPENPVVDETDVVVRLLAKLEATEGKELGRKYQIVGYPTLHLFVNRIPQVFDENSYCEQAVEMGAVQHVHNAKDSENQDNNSWPENPVVDEKDVVVLTEKNLSDFIATNQYVMVNFYASRCFWSRKLVPSYSAAATMLKGDAVLAKVEATEKLAMKYDINRSPTVYLFVGGVQRVSYYGERTRDAIATWMRQKMGLVVPTVTTAEEAERILGASSVIVMGFLETLETLRSLPLPRSGMLMSDVNVYQTDDVEVARLFRIDPQIKRPALVLLKWEVAKLNRVGFDDQFTRSLISDFVSENKLPSVITFTAEDASRIFSNPMKQLWLFATKYSLELLSAFEEAAKAFGEKLLFVYVETDDEVFGLGEKIADAFRVPQGFPRVVAYVANGDAKYMYDGELNFAGIKSFAEEFLEDKLSI
ncbi:unnamed protein product [Dovyalis caffra]|uniref:Thioredoxin domain-containing protein n=1 Tax=Dovyalis caffra TaxID=77055 RepID=A0AAV1QWN5_9ROSI|nr:unnamed protein product [Dovyalis caffra]